MFFKNFKKVLKKPDKEAEEKLRQEINEFGLEKKDLPAMILSAYLVFIPIVLGLLLLICLVAYLFIR